MLRIAEVSSFYALRDVLLLFFSPIAFPLQNEDF
jgi:hypothetical protein